MLIRSVEQILRMTSTSAAITKTTTTTTTTTIALFPVATKIERKAKRRKMARRIDCSHETMSTNSKNPSKRKFVQDTHWQGKEES